MEIRIQNLRKAFGRFPVLKDIDLDIRSGELVALLGPSGCGKTTLLRILAGLETPDHGSIRFGERDASRIHAGERGVGFVFQHYALFRHMDVFENVAYGLRAKPRKLRPSDEKIQEQVMELLRLVQMEAFAHHRADDLSGGQRQRVALARALAVAPELLLLDEPFGALDSIVRQELRSWLRRLHDTIHTTSVFVTHDREEAFEVADRIVLLHEGRIVQCGAPEEIYDHPADPFVYEFLGASNRFTGDLQPILRSATRSGATIVGAPGESPIAYVRPQDFMPEELESAPIRGTIGSMQCLGDAVRLDVKPESEGQVIRVQFARDLFQHHGKSVGETIGLRPRLVHLFGVC